MAVDVFTLVGTISVEWSQAKKGLSALNTTAELTATRLYQAEKAARQAGEGLLQLSNTIRTLEEKTRSWNTTVGNLAGDGISRLRTTFVTGINGVVSSTAEGLANLLGKFTTTMEAAKSTVSDGISRIRALFNFTWSLPNIKLPHFSIKPSGWSIGDLLKGSIPSLGISWYAKAMDDGMIMNSPTIFGVNGSQLMAGGEAGSETVVGTDSLMNMVRAAVREERDGMGERLEEILDLLSEALPTLISGQTKQLVLDTGVVVGTVDTKLGIMATRKERGN